MNGKNQNFIKIILIKRKSLKALSFCFKVSLFLVVVIKIQLNKKYFILFLMIINIKNF